MKTGIKTMEDGIMKKSLYIAASLLVLAACTRETDIEVPAGDMAITAWTETPSDTRTVVEGETHVYWEPGDEIAVFMGEQSSKFTTDITAASGTATFKGTFGDQGWPEEPDLWAVYPFSEDATFDGKTITTTLPSEQIAREGSFGKDMNLAIAHSNSSTLQFYNVGGGIRFSVTEEGIKKVMFEGLSGEIISGKVKIGFEGGLPVVKEITGGSQFITLLPPSGKETFEKDAWYYIVAIPGTLEGGYKLRFYKDSDYARKVSEKKVEIKRSIFGNIEKADNGIEYEATTTKFPETYEECKESVELSVSIQKEVSSILWGDNEEEISDIEAKIEKISMVEGVIYVDKNIAGTCISVIQRDSVCVNYLLFDPLSQFDDTSESNANSTSNTTSISHSKMVKSQTYYKGGEKALILAPFQWDFDKRIESVWIPELSKNYFPENIKYLPDSKAGVFQFKEELSKRYDFIIIDTHGVTGKRSRITPLSLKMENAFLCTATPYNIDVAWQIISSHEISSEEVAYCFTPDGDKYIAINPQILEGASFNDNCVIITACESAMMLNNRIPWFDAFTSKGSCVVSGATVSMNAGVLGPLADHLIQIMTLGCSFRDAFQYVARSHRMQVYCSAVFDLIGGDFNSFDIYNNYIYKQNENKPVLDFFLTNPIVFLNSPVINAENTSLSWEASSQSFPAIVNIATSAIMQNGNKERKYEPITFNQTFDVYVDGEKVSKSCFESGDNTRQSVTIPNPSVGLHSWKVITNIIEDGTGITLGSYASEEDYFTVIEEIKYETPEAKDLGLSVKWGSFNLGASKPEMPGEYFAWGETETYYSRLVPSTVWKEGKEAGYDWPSYKWCNGSSSSITKYNTSALTQLEPEDDAAHANLGDKWRTPTDDEWAELRNNCSFTWTALNGVNGLLVTSLKPGYTNVSIFLPAAGVVGNTSLYYLGESGFYWTSGNNTSNKENAGYNTFETGSSGLGYGWIDRCYGLSIRPVYGDQMPPINGDIEGIEEDPWN